MKIENDLSVNRQAEKSPSPKSTPSGEKLEANESPSDKEGGETQAATGVDTVKLPNPPAEGPSEISAGQAKDLAANVGKVLSEGSDALATSLHRSIDVKRVETLLNDSGD